MVLPNITVQFASDLLTKMSNNKLVYIIIVITTIFNWSLKWSSPAIEQVNFGSQ